MRGCAHERKGGRSDVTGTATDNNTGLIWLQNANCGGTKTWAVALAYCAALANGSCGLTDGSVAGDWRLPNRFELESLLHLGYCTPALSNAAGDGQWTSGDAFVGAVSDDYWSSTTHAWFTGYAWIVYLSYGLVGYDGKTGTSFVWPVRGGD